MTAVPSTTADEAEALRIFLRLIRPRPLADPYPLYARLRDIAPVVPIRFPGVTAGYLVSTFAGCSRLLRDPAFGPPARAHLDALRPGWHENAFTRCLYRSMVFLAGSSHRERRQAAARPFVPRQIGTFRTELAELAAMLVDRLAAHHVPAEGQVLLHAADHGGAGRLIAEYAASIRATTIVLGAPTHGGLSALMDASASQELWRHARSNILIVNPEAPPSPITANGSVAPAMAQGSGSEGA